ncbi:MAG: zf-HC2 domain-containing protein [Nitrospirae bacterium]|nr:zf-HC2 domain-containing protein [Nitrospirota bacterium]MBF0535659.1 zf-HC2 domain-containing protein [Nitrospirota bacterium]MBF0616965.1 zf-HC2 domain-containing protein [Nitrospirota bacterium]
MKIKHDDIQDKLHDYLKGALSEELTLIIKEHIPACNECAKEINVIESLVKNEVPDPGDIFFYNLARNVIRQAKETKPQKFRLWEFLRLNPIAVAALCLVIVLVVYNYAGFISVQRILEHSGNEIVKNDIIKDKVMDVLTTDDILYLEDEYEDSVSTDYDGEEYLVITL